VVLYHRCAYILAAFADSVSEGVVSKWKIVRVLEENRPYENGSVWMERVELL
jgi:hypothetical protein